MTRWFYLIFFFAMSVFATADNADWKVYASYHNPTQCVEMGGRIYVLANGDLYSYDPEDQSIETYDKAGVLTDFGISSIQVCRETNELLIIYSNGNIDIMNTKGEVYNISELKKKVMSDKTINEVYAEGHTLYISTNSGLVVLDTNRRIFLNLYYFGYAVRSICISDGYIFAVTSGGVFRGLQNANLLDPANWQKIAEPTTYKSILKLGKTYYILANNLYKIESLTPFKQSLATNDVVTKWFANGNRIYYTTNRNEFKAMVESGEVTPLQLPFPASCLAQKSNTYWAACGENGMLGMKLNNGQFTVTVGDITPNSPIRNNCYRMNMIGERLLVAGGNNYYPEELYVGQAMQYENGTWLNFDEKAPTAAVQEKTFCNVTDVVQDPNDPTHHFLSTYRSGLYEYRNYKYVKHITYDNSPLKTMSPNSRHYYYYVRTTGASYDRNGNLWMCNQQVDTVLWVMKPNNKWVGYPISAIANHPTFDRIVHDSRGWVWVNSRRTTDTPAGILAIDTRGTIDNRKDDRWQFHSTVTNQDGTQYEPTEVYSIAEDLDGHMWFGNINGLFMTENPEDFFNKNFRFTQVKIARKDGSGLADYLLTGVKVTCIAIDGANRKWIGTGGDGLYLLSADGQETLQRITAATTPLISDNINDIQINGTTGEVFISTDKGLCSFMSDAVDPEEELDKNNLKVYPNPVRPEDRRFVRITGFSNNCVVKVSTASGKLVYEGTSNGGEFTWNCRNSAGKEVASGVYYILGTDEDGNKGAATKVLIIR